MTKIIDLNAYRTARQLIERAPVQNTSFTLDDVRFEFARRVTEGRLPGRYAYEARPSDTEGEGI